MTSKLHPSNSKATTGLGRAQIEISTAWSLHADQRGSRKKHVSSMWSKQSQKPPLALAALSQLSPGPGSPAFYSLTSGKTSEARSSNRGISRVPMVVEYWFLAAFSQAKTKIKTSNNLDKESGIGPSDSKTDCCRCLFAPETTSSQDRQATVTVWCPFLTRRTDYFDLWRVSWDWTEFVLATMSDPDSYGSDGWKLEEPVMGAWTSVRGTREAADR